MRLISPPPPPKKKKKKKIKTWKFTRWFVMPQIDHLQTIFNIYIYKYILI